MKQFILDNIKKYPITVVAVVLLYLYINEVMANKESYRNCLEDVKRKDAEIAMYQESNRRDKEMLLEYALEIREGAKRQQSDSLLRSETEQNIKKIMRR